MEQANVRLHGQKRVRKERKRTMYYKGFSAAIHYDERDRIYHGQLTDTYDNVYFGGLYT